MAIENYGLTVYPRDDRGLLVDELGAFPGELGTLPAGSSHDFETDASPCEISDVSWFHSWIVADGASTWLPPERARLEERRARRLERMRALRHVLRPVP